MRNNPEQVNRIVSTVREATPFEYLYGLLWYPIYSYLIVMAGAEWGLTKEQSCAIFAVLSAQRRPQENWRIYMILMRDMEPWDLPCLQLERFKIASILGGEIMLGEGLKVCNFFADLMGRLDHICIDRHGASIVYDKPIYEGIKNTMYHYCADVFIEASELLGMYVAIVQSISWVIWRKRENNPKKVEPDRMYNRFFYCTIQVLLLWSEEEKELVA